MSKRTLLRVSTPSVANGSREYPGLVWLFTGTPEFFDTRRGVAGLTPLHDRIAFKEHGRFASLRQPQLKLAPFDKERLRKVALFAATTNNFAAELRNRGAAAAGTLVTTARVCRAAATDRRHLELRVARTNGANAGGRRRALGPLRPRCDGV